MLGNDIVDYSADEKKYLNHRYINRILSQLEIKYLALSPQKNVFLWSLWAAKEASFKAYQKNSHHTIFSPRKFHLEETALQTLLQHDCTQPLSTNLNYQANTIRLLLHWPNKTTVHCIAIADDSVSIQDVQVKITKLHELNDQINQSAKVREVAQQLLQCNSIYAQIVRPMLKMVDYKKPGPPVLTTKDNKILPHEISLSHHKTWLAVALLLR